VKQENLVADSVFLILPYRIPDPAAAVERRR
jgi:hypothetical protein